jgi:hypothetical protein
MIQTLNTLNKSLKGTRGLITMYLAIAAGSIGEINDLVIQIGDILNQSLSEDGAVVALVSVAMSIKLVVTDFIPKFLAKFK